MLRGYLARRRLPIAHRPADPHRRSRRRARDLVILRQAMTYTRREFQHRNPSLDRILQGGRSALVGRSIPHRRPFQISRQVDQPSSAPLIALDHGKKCGSSKSAGIVFALSSPWSRVRVATLWRWSAAALVAVEFRYGGGQDETGRSE
jgi:hypothetical protein